ncbi:MAG: PIG-L deacetylase family protein [Bdellovibrionota bacterium]
MNKMMVIAAHPDDEILGCGGIIAKLAGAGHSVHVVFLTGGVISRSGKSVETDENLKRMRVHAIAANKILGVSEKNIVFLSYEDQKLDTVPLLEVIKSLRELIYEHQPDTLFVHHPGDYNKDHRVCFEASLYASRPSPKEHLVKQVYTYEVLSSTERAFGAFQPFVPNTYFEISGQIEKKQKALACYEMELHESPHPRSIEGVQVLARHRGLEVGLNHAEAFCLIRNIEI